MKIICVGKNYAEHAKEFDNIVPDEPLLFSKFDTSLMRTHDFYIPEFTENVHFEVELVIKINKVGKHIQKEHAHKYYNEIGLGIDFTARDVQFKLRDNGYSWEKAKAFDNSAFVSDFFPKENFELSNTQLKLTQNGETKQDGNTKDMMFDVDTLISYISSFFTLKIGDLIYTGTPEGVGKVNEKDVLEGFLNEKKVFSVNIK